MNEEQAGAGSAADGAGGTVSAAIGGVVYPDYANPELLEKLPLAARTLLDTGCATGALGLAYLRRNPAARYLGIEVNPESAVAAGARLTEVFVGDAEVDPLPFDLPDGVDCLIYGDVLEHLRDPWAVLKRQAEALVAGGTAVVCMPNLEHWSVALRLLQGSFDYEDQGILDRTHLRWFTARTMGQALLEAGLELADVSPRPTDTGQAQKFVQAMAPGLAALGVDPKEYFNRAGPVQFIWRARKVAPSRIFIAATMLAPLGGVSEVRIVEPQRALRTDSAVLTAISAEPDFGAGLPETPKIAVLHRPLLMGETGLARIRALLAKDYLIVTEFDDHPVFMAQRGLDLSQLLSFKAVHAIQTSTASLGEVLAALPGLGVTQLPSDLPLILQGFPEYQSFGLQPALDHIAVLAAILRDHPVRHDRIYGCGSSYGGYIAAMMLKFLPNTFHAMVENSGFTEALPEEMASLESGRVNWFDGKGIRLCCTPASPWTRRDPASKYFVGEAVLRIRDCTDPAQYAPSRTHLASYHAEKDSLIPLPAKRQFWSTVGAKLRLRSVTVDDAMIDGRLFKTNAHGMDASLQLLADDGFAGLPPRAAEATTDFSRGSVIEVPAAERIYRATYRPDLTMDFAILPAG